MNRQNRDIRSLAVELKCITGIIEDNIYDNNINNQDILRIILILRETSHILDFNINLLRAVLFRDRTFLLKQIPANVIKACADHLNFNDIVLHQITQGSFLTELINNADIEVVNSIVVNDMGEQIPTFSVIYFITIPDFKNIFSCQGNYVLKSVHNDFLNRISWDGIVNFNVSIDKVKFSIIKHAVIETHFNNSAPFISMNKVVWIGGSVNNAFVSCHLNNSMILQLFNGTIIVPNNCMISVVKPFLFIKDIPNILINNFNNDESFLEIWREISSHKILPRFDNKYVNDIDLIEIEIGKIAVKEDSIIKEASEMDWIEYIKVNLFLCAILAGSSLFIVFILITVCICFSSQIKSCCCAFRNHDRANHLQTNINSRNSSHNLHCTSVTNDSHTTSHSGSHDSATPAGSDIRMPRKVYVFSFFFILFIFVFILFFSFSFNIRIFFF